MLKIINSRLIRDGEIYDGLTVYVRGKKIAAVTNDDSGEADEVIDAKGAYLSSGFIDMHSHGGGGSDFLDSTVDAFMNAARLHISHGTTSILPTACASTNEEMAEFLKAFKAAQSTDIGDFFVGIHLEGPYFSAEQGGAQDPKYLRTPKPEEYLPILEMSDDIMRWSSAPELDGADTLGYELKKRGILASIAHSSATYEDIVKALDAGYTHVTHLYSGTSTVTRRDGYRFAGIIESAFLIDDITVEIIADGCHLPAPLLKLIYKIKGPDKTALVTDSMRGAGMSEGETILGSLKNGRRVIIEDGVAKLPDRKSFAGSVATADRLIRTMVNIANVPLAKAVKMITETPAKIQNLKNKGFLREGGDADLTVFDDSIDVKYTILGGKTVYKK